MNKVFKNAEEAIADIEDGAVLMLGGFGLMRYTGKLHYCFGKKRIKRFNVHFQ